MTVRRSRFSVTVAHALGTALAMSRQLNDLAILDGPRTRPVQADWHCPRAARDVPSVGSWSVRGRRRFTTDGQFATKNEESARAKTGIVDTRPTVALCLLRTQVADLGPKARLAGLVRAALPSWC